MTVSDLIDELSKYPSDMALVSCCEEGMVAGDIFCRVLHGETTNSGDFREVVKGYGTDYLMVF